MKIVVRYQDGTAEDSEGNVLSFGLDRFVSDICLGEHCFMCGASPTNTSFNDEHIIPKWVLRKLDLYKDKITLPNKAQIPYERYVVPCCTSCNSFLGETVEAEIKCAFDNGHDSLNKYIYQNGTQKLFLWLALIFFKTHLKDSFLRKHLDMRKGEETIASDYDWSFMHHIHCLIRTLKTGVEFDERCFGSMIVLPATVSSNYSQFDFCDTYASNTVMLRIGDVAIVSVLDDSCASAYFLAPILEKITGSCSPLQLREILAHVTLINDKLKYRPRFFTKFDRATQSLSIHTELPETMDMEPFTKEEFGWVLYSKVSDYLGKITCPNGEFTEENLKAGNYRFLINEKNEFIANSMEKFT
ncbi:hypothetical protein ACORBP_004380 [Vibrio vulnificus]